MKNLHNVSVFGLGASLLCVMTGAATHLPAVIAVGFYSSPIWMFVFILTGGKPKVTPAPRIA